jgi:hypothetical protein
MWSLVAIARSMKKNENCPGTINKKPQLEFSNYGMDCKSHKKD